MTTTIHSPDQNPLPDAYERCYRAIVDAFERDQPVLIDALPAMGKSYGVVRWASETGNPLTVFTARHELYDQYEQWCEELGLTSYFLPSFHRDCPTARDKDEEKDQDNHGEAWKSDVRKAYRDGLFGPEIHQNARRLFGECLPCERGDGCPYMRDREVDLEDFDVLIGHYRHAYRRERSEGRYIVFDEFPEDGLLTEFDQDRLSEAVSDYLKRCDDLPFRNWRNLRNHRDNEERREEWQTWALNQRGKDSRDTTGPLNRTRGTTHALAPLLTHWALVSRPLENDWDRADLGNGRVGVRSSTNEEFTLLDPPNLPDRTKVVALDGTPTVEKWRLILGNDLDYSPVLTEEEKDPYLRESLGLKLIQTTDYAKHYSGRKGRSLSPLPDLAVFEAIREREGRTPALISTNRALDEYEKHGVDEIVAEKDHYNNIKGSNEFEDTRLGIVAGSQHYGDGYIQKWGALAGLSIPLPDRTKGAVGMNLDYGPFGNKILVGMRENEVLQAVMRFGRKEKDGERGATVYVHTAALPKWVTPVREIAEVLAVWGRGKGGMLDVIKAIKELPASKRERWVTKDVSGDPDVTISIQQVRTHLGSLADLGYIAKHGKNRGRWWSDICIDDAGRFGHVELAA